jgi:hypothetical protein
MVQILDDTTYDSADRREVMYLHSYPFYNDSLSIRWKYDCSLDIWTRLCIGYPLFRILQLQTILDDKTL